MTLTKSQKARRKQRPSQPVHALEHVSGQGDYYTEKVKPFLAKNLPKGTFSRLGGGAGAGFGTYTGLPGASVVGGFAGRKLGDAISRVLGFGDYDVRSNTISKRGKAIAAGELVPDFGIRGNATRVQHREYIGDLVVPTLPLVFTNTAYTINAGNPLLFPWLAQVAGQYQQYRFEGLVFEFKTMSSDITAGGPLGSVVLATNYDVLEDPYPSKVLMENAQYSVSAKPSMSQYHTVECDPSQTGQQWFYVRDSTSSLTTSQDARFADLGKFQVATTGLPGIPGQVLGELWASYDVVLLKPEISNLLSVGTKVSSNLGITAAIPYGTKPVIAGDLRIIVGPNYLQAVVTGDSLIVQTLAGTVLVNPTITASTVTATLLEASINATATFGIFVYRAKVTAVGQQFVLDTTGSATVVGGVARITSYNYTLA